MTRLDIQQLLRFFDGEAKDARDHSNAINTVLGEELGSALLVKYLQTSGHAAEILDDICTQGTRSGARLDCWILATRDGEKVLFQVEVKSWCAHSLGGKALTVDAAAAVREQHAIALWKRYWDASAREPRDKPLKKVLVPMKPPQRFAQVSVQPVACVWDPLHPEGKAEPWFTIEVGGPFSRLSWFSASLYLRSLLANGDQSLEVPMPLMDDRLCWFGKLVLAT